jgi:plastocyanin
VAGGALALALAGPVPSVALAQGAAAVTVTEPTAEHYAFTPGALTVAAGATVTWTNGTDAPHTVTSDTGRFGSGTLNQGQAFRFTFAQPGTYAYHCNVHPYMHGTIVVTAAAPAGASAAAPTQSTAGSAAAAASIAPAQVPARMPSTGAGGGEVAASVALIGGLLAMVGGLGAAGRRS